MDLRPYLVVPKLIPQPTWGGEYIAKYKGFSNQKILSMKIGQAYELSSETMLSTVKNSADLPIEIGDPSTGKTVEVIGDSSAMFPLQKLIDQDPAAVLGEKYVRKYGPLMQILIKFTQAKGNSFQVHVRPGQEFGHWKAKPESWYYFENGRATLGLENPTADRTATYKKICEAILAQMQIISAQVQNGTKTPGQAKVDAAAYIQANSPFEFVNQVNIPKGAIIDLAEGGIHHSWEEGESIPEGNILYEVQLNVMDNDCTLRSFDKGKIADDGKIRPIHIDDYFTALDTDPAKNDPSSLVQLETDSILFDTPYYKTKIVKSLFANTDSFQHVFVKEGILEMEELAICTGASVFIPKSFQLKSDSSASLLQTFF